MNVFFNTCHEAIDYTINNKLFGLHYSERFTPNTLIHMHDCCEIFLALSDANYFLINDNVYTIKKNDLFIINQFESHKVNALNKEKFLRYNFHVHPEFLINNSSLKDNFYKIFSTYNTSNQKITKISLDENSVELFCKLFESLKGTHDFGDDTYKKIIALEILINAGKIINDHKSFEMKDVQQDTLMKAINFINKNFTRKISLKDIADYCFISVNQLCALFKNHLSTTVIKYITSLRITLAKKYLSEGKNVTETAYSCGFTDYTNFIRTFKAHTGVPPKKYNKQTDN